MKIKDKMKLTDLSLKATMVTWTGSGKPGKIETRDLFGNTRVLWAVARWVTMTPEEKKMITDPLLFCFGATWSRTEWEVIMSPWPYTEGATVEDEGRKIDFYTMVVEPNRELLMDLVSRVSENSAREYIRKERAYYRNYRKRVAEARKAKLEEAQCL